MDLLMPVVFISFLLLVGVAIRSKSSVFQYFLMPSSLIGGLIGFGLLLCNDYLGLNILPLSPKSFEPFLIHTFALSFVSLTLTPKQADGAQPQWVRGGLWISIMQCLCMVGQTFLAALCFIAWNFLAGSNFSPDLGFFTALGFAQGVGQAIAVAQVWKMKFGIEVGLQLGLIFASLGFFVSLLVGVPLMRQFIKKGLNFNKEKASLEEQFITGIMDKDKPVSGGRETVHSSNLDTLSLHVAVLVLVYGAAIIERNLTQPFVASVCSHLGILGVIISNFWEPGMVFMHGIVMAFLTRAIMDKLGVGHLICANMQRRLTGFMVDTLLLSAILAIQFGVVVQFIGPIILSSVVVTLFTLAICYYYSRRSEHYGAERFAAVFGQNTGTVASGLVLLRILDPDFRTPIAMELAAATVWGVLTCGVIGFGVMITIPKAGLSAWIITAVAAAFLWALLYITKMVKKPQW